MFKFGSTSRYLLSLVAFLLLLLLAACGDSKKYEEEIAALQSQVESLQNIKANLEQQLQDMTIQEVKPESSLRQVEGSVVPIFETIDGVIKFPNPLVLPNSKDDVNNSTIRIGSRYTVTPSSNWRLSLDGTTLNVAHPSKIWGSLKSVTYTGDGLTEEDMRSILQSFFKGFPGTTLTYRKLYIDDRLTGLLVRAPIEVDQKEYVVNVGVNARNEYGFLMLFAYEKTDDAVQQELVDLLIRSMKFGDSSVKLE